MSHSTDAPDSTPVPVTTGRPPELLPLFDGLRLRRRRVGDAAGLNAAVTANLAHLRPWMPWARTAPAMAYSVEMAAAGERIWDEGTDFMYVVGLESDPAVVLGAFGLHGRIGPGALEIGYWVDAAHTGRSIATRAAAELTRAALALPGITRVEIHCDEANLASAAIPRKLGYRLDRIQDAEITAPSETGRKLIWVTER
ncbi:MULTISPECIES: GNAT family N-acetyltransferase [Kitasatospora]|uniref:RimJ/RimL family protein N-acetyltransferase n=2 Tax=Kitasatospora TaxID=2063 RepID=A0ABT1J5T5_9ACTN|nr:GNAT family N-acetyltransferase [Kitasatospora paracochleata]MCP2312478.1 RimJ/RimL family protein N-acetyltransferase [Kitasatospora paracochleata]